MPRPELDEQTGQLRSSLAAAPAAHHPWSLQQRRVCGVRPAVLALVCIVVDLAAVVLLWLASFRFRLGTLLSDVEHGGWRDYRFRTGLADVALLTSLQFCLVATTFARGRSRHTKAAAAALLGCALLLAAKFVAVVSQPADGSGADGSNGLGGQGGQLKLVLGLMAIGVSAVCSMASSMALLLAVRMDPGVLAALLQSHGVNDGGDHIPAIPPAGGSVRLMVHLPSIVS